MGHHLVRALLAPLLDTNQTLTADQMNQRRLCGPQMGTC